MLTAIAMLLAVAIVEIVMPVFAAFLEKPLIFSLANPGSLAMLVASIAIVGLLAGSYPALYLSKFKPAEVLKGSASSSGSALLRKSLVVFQFATSIALLIATGVVMAQMNYARNVDLGFDKSRNLVSELPYFTDLWELYEPMKAELEMHPDILSAVYSSLSLWAFYDGHDRIDDAFEWVLTLLLQLHIFVTYFAWKDSGFRASFTVSGRRER